MISRAIKSPQRQMRMLNFQVDGTGAASIGEGKFDGSLVDNGAGDYTVTFTKAFARVPSVVVTSKTANIIFKTVPSVSAVQVLAYQGTDGVTATDCDFDMLVVGADVEDQI